MINEKLDAQIAALNAGYQAESEFFVDSRKYFPRRQACIDLVEDIRYLLFPGYFDLDTPAGESSDLMCAERLLHVSRVLQAQIKKALLFDDATLDHTVANERANELTEKFLDKLPQVQKVLLTDIKAIYDGDPAANSYEEVLVAYPGFYATFVYRIAHELYLLGIPLIPRLMSEHAHGRTGIDINPGATIGEYFFIDHGTGVVIGETTIIGSHVKIYQGVTLGALSLRKGQDLSGVKRHPTLGDYVTVYSNASILGGDTVIGNGAVIGGSSFVCESVPENARVRLKDQEIVVRDPNAPEPAWFYVI